ncbi:MAG: hypothetical protein R6V06_09660 [Kiritimatiellia bacterium]
MHFLFWSGTAMWTTRDWELHFSNSITNNAASLRAPLAGHEATFDMDGQTWTLPGSFDLYSGRGGRIVMKNGFLNIGGEMALSATSDLDGVQTNGILVANNMQTECSIMNIDGVHARFDGGTLSSEGSIKVGVTASSGDMNASSLTLDGGVQCAIGHDLKLGDGGNTTGIFENVTGNLEVTNQLNVGANGYGSLVLRGGTMQNSGALYHYVAAGESSVGVMDISGGTNMLAPSGANFLFGRLGKAYLFGSDGQNTINCTVQMAYYAGSEAEMTLSGGEWDIAGALQCGRLGQARLICSGAELNVSSSLYLGYDSNGSGELEITGGQVFCGGNIPMGFKTGASATLLLADEGILRCNRIYKYNSEASIQTSVTFDGGTLQAGYSGSLIDSVDSVCLSTNGLTVDTMGYNSTIASELQNLDDQDGALTKLGSGTLSLTAARTATGPVSIYSGTLVANHDISVADGISKLNGTLTFNSGLLSLSAGAALSGTGTVTSVAMADGAVLCRDKSDHATTPLNAESFTTDGALTIELTGYSLEELYSAVPLIRTTSSLDVSSATVTLEGDANPRLNAMTRKDQDYNVLVVGYNSGTFITIR